MAAESFVLDASAIVELLTVGGDGHNASVREKLFADPSVSVVTAPHATAECLNTFRRLVRHKNLTSQRALQAVVWLCGLSIDHELTDESIFRAWDFRDSMSAYDASYAALADRYQIPLITNDRKLIKACEQEHIEAIHLSELTF